MLTVVQSAHSEHFFPDSVLDNPSGKGELIYGQPDHFPNALCAHSGLVIYTLFGLLLSEFGVTLLPKCRM